MQSGSIEGHSRTRALRQRQRREKSNKKEEAGEGRGIRKRKFKPALSPLDPAFGRLGPDKCASGAAVSDLFQSRSGLKTHPLKQIGHCTSKVDHPDTGTGKSAIQTQEQISPYPPALWICSCRKLSASRSCWTADARQKAYASFTQVEFSEATQCRATAGIGRQTMQPTGSSMLPERVPATLASFSCKRPLETIRIET